MKNWIYEISVKIHPLFVENELWDDLVGFLMDSNHEIGGDVNNAWNDFVDTPMRVNFYGKVKCSLDVKVSFQQQNVFSY